MILVLGFWIICLRSLSYYQPLLFLTLNHEKLAIILNALTIAIVMVTFGVEKMNTGHLCFAQASKMVILLEANVNISFSSELLKRNLTVFDEETKETRIVSLVYKVLIFLCLILVIFPYIIMKGFKVSKTIYFYMKAKNRITPTSTPNIEGCNSNTPNRQKCNIMSCKHIYYIRTHNFC